MRGPSSRALMSLVGLKSLSPTRLMGSLKSRAAPRDPADHTDIHGYTRDGSLYRSLPPAPGGIPDKSTVSEAPLVLSCLAGHPSRFLQWIR